MGWPISEYNISELSKISAPNRVKPTLFWLIPLGEWYPGTIDKLWKHFTTGASRCKDLGLMLRKSQPSQRDRDILNRERDRRSNSPLDLPEVAGELQKILPQLGNNADNDSQYKENDPRLVILSGSYPQPGWGVVLSGRVDHKIEKIIGLLETELSLINEDKYAIFTDAAASYDEWQEIDNKRPSNINVRNHPQRQQFCSKILDTILKHKEDIKRYPFNNYFYVELKKLRGNFQDIQEYSEAFEHFFKVIQ